MQHELLRDQAYILGRHAHSIEALERGHETLRREVRQLRAWLARGAILAALWAAALGSHLSQEQLAELLAALLKAALKL